MPTKGAVQEKTFTKIKEPGKYNVVMHNDDFTTMEFVVEVLEDIFHKNSMEAEILMLTVHKSGKAVIGSYPYDIAVSKVNTAISRAKSAGFPFRMTVEEA
jgi:ATP-dependent Clp protease adaptor protein ClpS